MLYGAWVCEQPLGYFVGRELAPCPSSVAEAVLCRRLSASISLYYCHEVDHWGDSCRYSGCPSSGGSSLPKLCNHYWFSLTSHAGCFVGEAEEDGYDDEYALEDLEIGAADYIKAQLLGNFRAAWEALPAETEMADEYALGERASLEDAIDAVVGILGMQPCEGTDAVPPNARCMLLYSLYSWLCPEPDIHSSCRTALLQIFSFYRCFVQLCPSAPCCPGRVAAPVG